jgi:hypothetical protein
MAIMTMLYDYANGRLFGHRSTVSSRRPVSSTMVGEIVPTFIIVETPNPGSPFWRITYIITVTPIFLRLAYLWSGHYMRRLFDRRPYILR